KLVEFGALDLVGHRMPVVPGSREDDRPRAAGLLVPEEGAVFLLEAGRADLLSHAELLEDREAEGEQRLAHVEAGKLLLLEDDDGPPGPGERGRDSRARGTAADHGRVVELGHWAILRPARPIRRSNSRMSESSSADASFSTASRSRSEKAR